MLLNITAFLVICAHSMEEGPTQYADQCMVVPFYADQHNSLSLSWIHSVEKSEWHETYVREGNLFRLTNVRIQGSGAGMEIPTEAILQGNYYHYVPNQRIETLSLTYSPFSPDYTLCIQHTCHTLFKWIQRITPSIRDESLSYRIRITVLYPLNTIHP